MRPSAGRSRRAAFFLLLAVLAPAACAGRAPRPVPTLPASVGDDVPAIRAVVTAFLVGEARLEESVDTLLAPGADFIVTGVSVAERPRLAGVSGPGVGTVRELRIELAGDQAWAVAGYGWVGRDPSGEERALATIVLQRVPAGWRIRHVHSSHVERWDR